MCGIAGLISPNGQVVNIADISNLSAAMDHRGPDDLGFLGWSPQSNIKISRNLAKVVTDAQVAFAHKRLSIIDEGEGGWQPMATADKRFIITFNGEIYNYVELKSELQSEGVAFSTSSDTEVLLKALAKWGIDKTLSKLVGMFAFSLLDTEERTVTLARDPFGIKPLSYTMINGSLAFASEITQLLKITNVKRKISPQALYNYLRFGFTDRGAETLFSAIKHLPAAHYATINLDNPTILIPKRYWRAQLYPTLDISFDEAAAELRKLFIESVKLHLRSDVPVGAALSGGIDSSAVVGAMRNLGGPDLDLHTFTYIAPGETINEERWADMAAKDARATIHKVALSSDELAQSLDTLITTQGEPFGSTSIFAQNKVFQLASQNGIKVTLDGQGADEIIAGYMPFLAARLATMLKKGEFTRSARFLKASGVNAGGQLGIAMRSMRFILPPTLQTPARYLIGESLTPSWMNENWFQSHGTTMQAPQKAISGDILRHELLESLTDRVLPALLRYQDRNSMAHSIESRVPFLIPKLVDFLYSLPEEFLISDNGETKSIFRKAMEGVVPEAILERRDKIGFATPQENWLGAEKAWLNGVLSSDYIDAISAFAPTGISQEINAVKKGHKPLSSDVWRWVNLIKWSEIFDVDYAV